MKLKAEMFVSWKLVSFESTMISNGLEAEVAMAMAANVINGRTRAILMLHSRLYTLSPPLSQILIWEYRVSKESTH